MKCVLPNYHNWKGILHVSYTSIHGRDQFHIISKSVFSKTISLDIFMINNFRDKLQFLKETFWLVTNTVK